MKVPNGNSGSWLPKGSIKRAAWAAPDVLSKVAFGALAYGSGGATAAATLGSLPASVINLHQAYDEKKKGVGSWKELGANALNVGVGVAAAGVTIAAFVDPSLQTAAMVGFGLSAGTNVLTGVINYAHDMGSTHKAESTGETGAAVCALGQEAKKNWKSGLLEGAKFAGLGAAAGAVGFPLIATVANCGLNVVGAVANVFLAVITLGFGDHATVIHTVLPSLTELAATGGGIGAAVGLTAGLGIGLFPQLKRSLAKPAA